MCLFFPITSRLDKIDRIAYKTMLWHEGEWVTPFYLHKVIDNKLTANGDPEFVERKLEGGVIHCNRTRNGFSGEFGYKHHERTFKVRGKNVIAYNTKEIAFDEVEFLEPLTPLS